MVDGSSQNNKDLKAHGAMLLAMVLFGLMATFSKDVLTHGGHHACQQLF
ncbi:MAG: hypothetical protein IKX18_00700 [Muribaculaceae bacterium]|nr:hypothetical protein [Muribaculaceae bacterium]